MSIFSVSRIDNFDNLVEVENIICDWRQKVQQKEKQVRCRKSDAVTERLLDAHAVANILLDTPLRRYSTTYIPNGNESSAWKCERDFQKTHEIYVAFDRDGRVQGIALLTISNYSKKIASLKGLLANPDSIPVCTNFGKAHGVGSTIIRHLAVRVCKDDPKAEFHVSAYVSCMSFYEKCGFVVDELVDEEDVAVSMTLSELGKQKFLQASRAHFALPVEPKIKYAPDLLPYPLSEELAEAIGQVVGDIFDARIHQSIAEFAISKSRKPVISVPSMLSQIRIA